MSFSFSLCMYIMRVSIIERSLHMVNSQSVRLPLAVGFAQSLFMRKKMVDSKESGKTHIERGSLRRKPPQRQVSLEIVSDEELSFEEERDRLRLERQVERAFYQAGIALKELRDRRLYRSTHRTFKEYCQDRFGFTRSHSYRLIDAAIVIDNLVQMSPNGRQNNSKLENVGDILPTSERQCRPLTKLKPEQQREIWREAVESSKGKVPSGKVVADLVAKFQGNSTLKKQQVSSSNKNENHKQIEEGINYMQGIGCEFYVRVSQETWEKLNKYAEYIGTASLNGAVARLLREVNNGVI